MVRTFVSQAGLSRMGRWAAGLAALAGACLSTSCGGGGVAAARQMVLVEFLFVDRALVPAAPTGAEALPRNAQLLMKFSELVDPATVNLQSIQIRFNSSDTPQGSFSVDGSQVRFDPTVTNQGQPNPFGFEPVTQYTVFIPSFEDQQTFNNQFGVVRNRGDDPNQSTFRTTFETGAGYLRELVPPQVLSVFFEPEPELLTGNIPGNGRMGIVFSEPMDPATFIAGPALLQPPPLPPVPASTTIDVRYDAGVQINIDNLAAGRAIPGIFQPDSSATIYYFLPTFSFGSAKLVFYLQCFQGLRDLSGNLLVNPRTFGTFTCDGLGATTGGTLDEGFVNTIDADLRPGVTDALWGTQTLNTLEGQPVSSREMRVFGYREAGQVPNSGRGQYAAIPDPLTGAALNAVLNNINPPTKDGRRVMLAFSDDELGASGTITAVKWGPDSNATFAALYQNIYLRMGYQANDSMNLATSFSGNYQGSALTVFNGNYSVAQAANVGDTPGEPVFAHVGGYNENPGCQVGGWNLPLFTATGFVSWPTLTTFFDWDPGDIQTPGDSIFLFDMSVPEGDTWQQFRAWFGVTFPCSGVLIGGYPQRRLYSTYEDDAPNPTANFAAGILNPEPTLYDTAFVVTKRVSLAQTKFYTYPGFSAQAFGGQTFGDLSNYKAAQLTPSVQAGGASVEIFYQGADAVETDRVTINQAAPFTGWTKKIDDCDGMRCLRWQINLISNLISNATAKLTRVIVPLTSN